MKLGKRIRSAVLMRRVQALIALLLIALVLTGPLHLFKPQRVKAHAAVAPVQVGTSFSPRRAAALGLEFKSAFKRLESFHFRIIRLSAYWDETESSGYDQLDWLMSEAQRSHQPVALSVGMKGLGWPEFFIPENVQPADMKEGHDLADDADVAAATLSFIERTVARYRDNRALVAWQVENEPFNRAGPMRLWIDPAFVRREVAAVKLNDSRHRPVIVNAFSHFNLIFDHASDRQGFNFKRLLGFDADQAERDSLSVLDRGDILGLDVYTAIGYRFLGQSHLSRADSDWADQLSRWREQAVKQAKRAWITEAQAEPWEATSDTYTRPLSISPKEIQRIFLNLKDAGYTTVLFWGSEYWLWRADEGDSRWLDAIRQVLGSEARAPTISLMAA
jgi:hypothetical protein